MNEFFVVANGPTESLVIKKYDEYTYKVIAKCENRDNALAIVEALNPVPEIRTTWSELERVAHERGR